MFISKILLVGVDREGLTIKIAKASYKKLYNKLSQLEHDGKNDYRIPILVGRIRMILAGKVQEGKKDEKT